VAGGITGEQVVWGMEVPQRGAGAEPWWGLGLGAKHPEAIGTM